MSEYAPFRLDVPTVLSVGFALSFMPLAFILGTTLIPASQQRNRFLFFWHAYDALTHLFIEGAFLYECFFSYVSVPSAVVREPYFLGYRDRLYGPAYGSGPTARLWQEYAKADHRWETSDPTVISLEILTVLLGGPAAAYISYLLYRVSQPGGSHEARGKAKARLWLIAPALAVAELYGGWMTFAPEWLTASSQLETRHPVYLWLYLVFFNVLWVFIPIWVLTETAKELRSAFVVSEKEVHHKKKH
jgi:hypothetical protein